MLRYADRLWQQTTPLLASTTASLAAIVVGVLAAVAFLPPVRRQVLRFLIAPVAPLNLAILRIAVFGVLLVLLNNQPLREFAAESSTSLLPVSVGLVDVLMPVALAATAFTLIGALSRTAACISSVLSVYLLGIPQWAGDVDCIIQPAVLVALMLSTTRIGDALSVDALYQAVRQADRGQVRQAKRHVCYGMPIRLSMLVFALTYFFAGAWQLAAHSEGIQLSTEFESVAAMAAIAMALTAPVALLWRPSRLTWSFAGVVFHNVAAQLGNVAAYPLQVMYVMSIDWQRFLGRLGQRVFGRRILVLYDGNCKLCRRTMAMLLVLDWLRALKPVNAFDRHRLETNGLGHLNDAALMTDMHAAERSDDDTCRITRGYDAYQRIAWRVPLLWLTLPFIYLPPIAAVGNRIYRRVADTRACAVPLASDVSTTQLSRRSLGLVKVAAAVILVAQIASGVGGLANAWPVACRPLFESLGAPVDAESRTARSSKVPDGSPPSWPYVYTPI